MKILIEEQLILSTCNYIEDILSECEDEPLNNKYLILLKAAYFEAVREATSGASSSQAPSSGHSPVSFAGSQDIKDQHNKDLGTILESLSEYTSQVYDNNDQIPPPLKDVEMRIIALMNFTPAPKGWDKIEGDTLQEQITKILNDTINEDVHGRLHDKIVTIVADMMTGYTNEQIDERIALKIKKIKTELDDTMREFLGKAHISFD